MAELAPNASQEDERGEEVGIEGEPSRRRPCGEHTVAVLALADADYYFCAFDDEYPAFEAILEVSRGGSSPRLQQFECAADVLDALSREASVLTGVAVSGDTAPTRLRDSCDVRHANSGPQTLDLSAPPHPQFVGTYCTGSGQSNFGGSFGSPCWNTWNTYSLPNYIDPGAGNYYCSDGYDPPNTWQCYTPNDPTPQYGWVGIGYCRSGQVTQHTRTGTVQLGVSDLSPGVSLAQSREQVASCGGATQFQSYYKPSGGGAWVQTLNFSVASDTSANWVYSSSTASDIQYVAASANGAYHRYTGGFRN